VTVPFLNPGAQFQPLRAQTLAAVEEVLTRGHFILGPNVAALESEIAQMVGVPFGVGVNSGSDALTLALRALDIGPGDEVITSPFTYIAPAESIHQVGARIVFADVDSRTFCLDVHEVEKRITARTKAIIPVHLFGQAAPMGELLGLSASLGLPIVEDCAQAIGATFQGKAVGGLGKIGCFSFYPTKNLGAYGDGGMCVTADPAVAHRLRMLRVHGIERRYHHDLHGYNSRLDELQAAILRVKLPHLAAWNERRAEIAQRYSSALAEFPLSLPQVAKGNSHSYHVYAVLLDDRDALQKYLVDHGVATLIYYPVPLHLQKCYADQSWTAGDYPVAEMLARRILPLPMYPELTDEQVDYVIAQVRGFFDK
jgi:dTDP-4-amino-4,6-dideoxygalactose transaminase